MPDRNHDAAAIGGTTGAVARRDRLTVVVSNGPTAFPSDSPTPAAVMAAVDALADANTWTFDAVAAALHQLVVEHRPAGVAALLNIEDDPMVFLFDEGRAGEFEHAQALSDGAHTSHQGEGRLGWTTKIVTGPVIRLGVVDGEETPGWGVLHHGLTTGCTAVEFLSLGSGARGEAIPSTPEEGAPPPVAETSEPEAVGAPQAATSPDPTPDRPTPGATVAVDVSQIGASRLDEHGERAIPDAPSPSPPAGTAAPPPPGGAPAASGSGPAAPPPGLGGASPPEPGAPPPGPAAPPPGVGGPPPAAPPPGLGDRPPSPPPGLGDQPGPAGPPPGRGDASPLRSPAPAPAPPPGLGGPGAAAPPGGPGTFGNAPPPGGPPPGAPAPSGANPPPGAPPAGQTPAAGLAPPPGYDAPPPAGPPPAAQGPGAPPPGAPAPGAPDPGGAVAPPAPDLDAFAPPGAAPPGPPPGQFGPPPAPAAGEFGAPPPPSAGPGPAAGPGAGQPAPQGGMTAQPVGYLVDADNAVQIPITATTVIGSRPDGDPEVVGGSAAMVTIDDPALNDVHARIRINGHATTVETVGNSPVSLTTYGSGGVVAIGPTPHPLQPGDAVHIGSRSFVYHPPGAAL